MPRSLAIALLVILFSNLVAECRTHNTELWPPAEPSAKSSSLSIARSLAFPVDPVDWSSQNQAADTAQEAPMVEVDEPVQLDTDSKSKHRWQVEMLFIGASTRLDIDPTKKSGGAP